MADSKASELKEALRGAGAREGMGGSQESQRVWERVRDGVGQSHVVVPSHTLGSGQGQNDDGARVLFPCFCPGVS